jgi:tetratricopeptide (TPR) repeat protein
MSTDAHKNQSHNLINCLGSLFLATSTAFSGYMLPPLALAALPTDNGWEQTQKAGTLALDRNEYWIAEPTLKNAVIKAGAFGDNDMRLAKSLGELGRLYTVRGRFSEAEPYLEEELCVKEKALGLDSPQLIPAMASMIRFYLLHDKASKAEPLTEEVLSIVEGKMKEPLAQAQTKMKAQKGVPLQGWAGTAAPVVRDPFLEWAIACDDLGELYRVQGNFDTADRLFKVALDVKSTVLGKEHLSLGNSYTSLAEVCAAKNENADAEYYFKDALSYTERILPPENPLVYSRLDKLARCLIKSGKYQQAEELYIRAQDFWKHEPSKYGSEARAMYALGSIYVEEKKYDQAAPVLARALEMAERINGPASIQLVPFLQKYAYTLYYLGRRPERDQLMARANTIIGGTL